MSALRLSAINAGVASLLLISCTGKKDTIVDALHHLPGFKLAQQTKAIVILSDNSCLPCNESFSHFVTASLSDPAVQFVIAAHANHLDLAPYIASPRKDIVYDTQDYLATHNIIKSSTVVFLRDGVPDTTISVDAKQLNGQLSYLQGRMR